MSKRVKISLITSVIFCLATVTAVLLFPSIRISNRNVDIFVIPIISGLISYVFIYFLIRGLEKRDERRETK